MMRLTISLDEELYRYVRARGKREDKSMSAVINEVIRRELNPTYEERSVPLPSLAERWPVYRGPLVDPLPRIPTSTGELDYEEDLEKAHAIGALPADDK